MKIVVVIKQVPDTEAAIRIDAGATGVAEAGLKFIINPYDEYALEEALRLKEAHPGSTVTAVALGPARVTEALRSAAAMGADEVLLLRCDHPPADSFTAATLLAAAVKKQAADLILTGKESIDDGSMELGPMLAGLLDIACMTVATKVSLANNRIAVECETDDGSACFEAPLPALVTCQKGLNEPRYPSIRGKMAAMKMVIPEEPAAAAAGQLRILSLALPAGRQGGKVVGEGAAAVPELIRLLRSEAQVI